MTALHGVLNGNSNDCLACFQGVANSSAAEPPDFTTPQDECCIARQLAVAELDTGWMSLAYQKTMTANQTMELFNPTCVNLMVPPAPRTNDDLPPMDDEGGSDILNIERAVVRL